MKNIIEIEKSIQKKYRDKLWSPFIKALKDYEMVNDGDKIAIAISGGKDSLLLAKLFQELKRASDTKFEVVFISMNPGFNQENLDNLRYNLKNLNIDCTIYDERIFEIAEKLSKNYPCYMCARMRRGTLYSIATKLGCNKLALGHHMDDVIETTIMSMFYMGKFETMLPKLQSDNYNIELIRPLYYIEEKDIIKFTRYNEINAMNCGCEVASGAISTKRTETKILIEELVKNNKNLKANIMASIKNVNIEKIISYKYKNNYYSLYNKMHHE